MKEEVPSPPGHVIYRPRNLDALGALKLGVVAWGNGGCWDDGAFNRLHLLELASHGCVAIANGHTCSGPDAKPQPQRPPLPAGMPPPQSTNASELIDAIDAIDWAIEENQPPGSPYSEHIDPESVAVSGLSCGGVQAMTVAPDPRIKTCERVAEPATFVLVHGATVGAFFLTPVAEILRRRGHRVFVPTLTGLGERSHLLSREVNMTTSSGRPRTSRQPGIVARRA